jgi:uncharacterized protein (TIGR03083 family)
VPETHAGAYAGVRERVSTFLRATDPAVLDAPVPATPEWRGRDVLAHFVGVNDDVINGRLEGIATDSWTAAQVDARRSASVADMLDEWAKLSPEFEGLLTAAPEEISGQALFDAMTHEHDLRNALGIPGARDSESVDIAWSWIAGARTRGGLPAIRMITESDDIVAGAGEPRATVEASRFELLRAATGRRSASEIAGYRWDPEPEPELLLGGPIFSLRAEPLNE